MNKRKSVLKISKFHRFDTKMVQKSMSAQKFKWFRNFEIQNF